MTASHVTFTYTQNEFVDALSALGITRGSVVSLQVSLGRIGLPEGLPADYHAIATFVINAFLVALGRDGTLIVPTYSYSIGKGEVFDVAETPSRIGEFSEVFRRYPGVTRSRDPMLSSAGIGPRVQDLLGNISRSCFGDGSTFHRLREADARICTFGISLYWATFRHHIEEMAAVPFRFHKQFRGRIRENGHESEETWTYFAAPRLSCCEPNGLPLERLVRTAGLLKVAPLGRGEVMAIRAREYFDIGMEALKRDPWLTAKGPPQEITDADRI
jgi:aminoglycoside 3-N-acetyltransferase